MSTRIVNVIGTDIHCLGILDGKLELIWEPHDCPRLTDATLGVENEVLVRTPVNSNIDTLTPSDVLTGDSSFS